MADRINNGGAAFPAPQVVNELGYVVQYAELGMSLRDWFAAQALIGICAFSGRASGGDIVSRALNAYAHADAMIAERAQ